MIIKAELRPKAGSSIFLSKTVTPVYFDNKVFDRNRSNDFQFTEWLEKDLLRILQRLGYLEENSIGTFRGSNTFFSHFSSSGEKNGHNIASIF